MDHVLVVGGGLAGCTAALELANKNIKVTIIEKSAEIGGKVRHYGCKATDRCANCGLCLAAGLWDKVKKHENINISTETELIDISGKKGNYSVVAANKRGTVKMHGIASIAVCIGFKEFAAKYCGNIEVLSGTGNIAGSKMNDGVLNSAPALGENNLSDNSANIISGLDLEKLISKRTGSSLPVREPRRIAFIQCFGSRDLQEKAPYCSRVCCGYSTRAARVFKHIYPGSEIVFFYMDLQWVEKGEYFNLLKNEGIEFVRCRPVKVRTGKTPGVLYEQPGTDGIIEREFDLVVLSEGIHPPEDADKIAEICKLGINGKGFLRYVRDAELTGIYIAGCASGPKRIEEVQAEALTVARDIWRSL